MILSTEVRPDEELDALEAGTAPEALSGLVVTVTTPLYPTEDPNKVVAAIASVLPALGTSVGGDAVTSLGEGPLALARLRRRLREMRIRDAARSVMRRGIVGDTLTFTLNKQSATTRIPSFATEASPLGDLEVRVEGADPTAVVEWLCEAEAD